MSTDSKAMPGRGPNRFSGNAILGVGPINSHVAQVLTTDYRALSLPNSSEDQNAFLAEFAASIRVAVCSGPSGVGAELMERLTSLEAIVNFGAGYDSTDVAQAAERGISISNTPDVLTDCVADIALGLYLDLLRSLSAADRFVRSEAWASGHRFPLATRASRKRVGILGLGRIGAAIALRLEAFGCEIHYHNRSPVLDSPYKYHGSAASLAEATDVLIVAASASPASAGMVDAHVLEKIGPKGFLINVGRGSLVNERALVAALENGLIAGAGLDVFASEPHVPKELLDMDRVVLLPHLGSATHETRIDMAALTLANLRSYVDHGKLLTPIS